MKAYLSELMVTAGTGVARPQYDAVIDKVLTILRTLSVDVVRSEVFTSYPEIDRHIGESDLFVAVVDDFWTSSTWKAYELSCGSGTAPLSTTGTKKKGNYAALVFLCRRAKKVPFFGNLRNTRFFRTENTFFRAILSFVNFHGE